MIEIIPSILTNDESDLRTKIEVIKEAASLIHIDVMDGKFVESTSLSLDQISSVLEGIDLTNPIELHLMVEEPQRSITKIKKVKNISAVILHLDAVKDVASASAVFKTAGIKVGLSFGLHEKVDCKHAPFDYFLVLAESEPGYSGTPFEMDALIQMDKIREKYKDAIIEVDGGINEINGRSSIHHGANRLISNSYIFKNSDPVAAFHTLQRIAQEEKDVKK